MFYNNTWGTVCDDFWGKRDATVVCRQLGFLRAIAAFRFAHFGRGEGEGGGEGGESVIDVCGGDGEGGDM